MAIFKCTMLFSQTSTPVGGNATARTGGWSESVYRDTVAPASLVSRFLDLCTKRAALLSTNAAIVGQRYQQIDPFGKTTTGGTVLPGSAGPCDVPQMALTYVLFALNSPNARRFTLRGIPDAVVTTGEYNPAGVAGFNNNFLTYLSQFFQWNFRAYTAPSGQVPILTISDTGAVVLASPLTLAVHDRVRISGVSAIGKAAPSGSFRVLTVTDSTHFTIDEWPNVPGQSGLAWLPSLIYPFFAPAQTPTPKVVVRKVGRPFGGYRGRASARA